jgi:hypothetical protein
MILNHLLGLIHDYMLPISDLAKSGQRAVISIPRPGREWTLDSPPHQDRGILHHRVFRRRAGEPRSEARHCLTLRRSRPLVGRHSRARVPRKPTASRTATLLVLERSGGVHSAVLYCAYDAVHACAVAPCSTEYVASMESHWPLDGDAAVMHMMEAVLFQMGEPRLRCLCRFATKLRDWSAIGRLHLVRVSVLLINGRADKANDQYAVEPLFYKVPPVR